MLKEALEVAGADCGDLLARELQGRGDGVGDFLDGDGGFVGFDQEAVEWGGSQGIGVETGAEREVAPCVEQRACDVLIASHTVDGKRHCGESRPASCGQDFLGASHVVNHRWFAQAVSKLQMANQDVGLAVEVPSAQGVHTRLTDSQDLWVTGASLQQIEIVIGERAHTVPGMKSNRIAQAGLRVEMPWVHRDERCGGVRAMGMEVEEVHIRL